MAFDDDADTATAPAAGAPSLQPDIAVPLDIVDAIFESLLVGGTPAATVGHVDDDEEAVLVEEAIALVLLRSADEQTSAADCGAQLALAIARSQARALLLTMRPRAHAARIMYTRSHPHTHAPSPTLARKLAAHTLANAQHARTPRTPTHSKTVHHASRVSGEVHVALAAYCTGKDSG